MAGLTLKNIYKVYAGRNTQKKGFVKTVKGWFKKSEQPSGEVKKRSGNFVAVKDFNMEIEDGEFIVFVGPSGCGKSTTLRMIAGLEDISSGELYIDGKLVNDVDPKDRDIAMVFQSYALYPHMTAQQIIEFALKLRKIPEEKKDANGNPVLEIDKKKIADIKEKIKAVEADILNADDEQYKEGLKARKQQLEDDLKYYSETPVQAYTYRHMTKEEIATKVQWAAKVLNIEELLDNKPAEMSGGQRQRIALGRAMVRDPKVFLLDEPLSNLDAKLRTTMRSEIVKLHKELKTTFIYVTHDQIEAMTMGTRIVVMKLGVVQQIDTPTNLYDYPENKFVAGFIGTPQMNFFDVTVQKSGAKLVTAFADGQIINFSLDKLRNIDKQYLDGEKHGLTLGIRGESIAVAGEKTEKSLKTEIVIKEVLGNTTQLFVRLGGADNDYIISVPERTKYEAGDGIYITFNERNVHLFDAETELSVMGREAGNK